MVLTLYTMVGKTRHVTHNKVSIFTTMKTVREFIKMMKKSMYMGKTCKSW